MAKIPRPDEELVSVCETHVHFLREARERYRDDRERFKQIAAELRILVCRTRNNKPLLLDLMDEYGVGYTVQPPGPPDFPFKRPIPMVGWRDDPLTKEIQSRALPALGDPEELQRLQGKQATAANPVPLRDYIDRALAVSVRGKDYSYREMTLKLADQLGGAHEDEAVDEHIVTMQQFRLGGDDGAVLPLLRLADKVVAAATQFITHMAQYHGYRPSYFRVEPVALEAPGRGDKVETAEPGH